MRGLRIRRVYGLWVLIVTDQVTGEGVAGRRPCDIEKSAVSSPSISRENSCTPPRSTLLTASNAYKKGTVDGKG
jgi:hypothetical protein